MDDLMMNIVQPKNIFRTKDDNLCPLLNIKIFAFYFIYDLGKIFVVFFIVIVNEEHSVDIWRNILVNILVVKFLTDFRASQGLG
ncbi:hypothetical protein WI80_04055 [Burkholderia ubonensis]|nr:hypothetical protein WI75_03085 [Burkholderia ubonensis]KVD17644.1 hypothetical protein WI80_04055 [Burkholderia ubonensis]KVU06595.1 hypothetical protein WK62_10825 [Burkholderia ubonensis]KVU23813.1 hypothetical protein WK63_28505 [Burkholderia ubonensis]